MNRRGFVTLTTLLAILGVMVFCSNIVNAAEKKENLYSESYEVNEGAKFTFASDDKVTSFGYGRSALGTFYIQGAINDPTEFNGVKAYGTSGNITFGYDYNNSFQTGTATDWNLIDSGWFEGKISIAGEEIKPSKNIDKGAIVIQKSSDGKTWENVASLSNVFSTKTTGRDSLYTTTDEDMKQGMYYRAVVVYSMKKQTKAGGFAGWGEEYDKRTFAEVYTVFLCSDNDYCSVYDLTYRTQMALPATVEEGFYIQKNGSSATVKVQRENGSVWYAGENATYTDPGKYTITITTQLKKEFVRQVTVSTGVNTRALVATTYDCGDNKGYKAENVLSGSAECNVGSHFNVYVGHSSQKEIIKSRYQGTDSYGVQGSRAEIYAQLSDCSTGWAISSDSWGKKEKETVNGVTTGEVGTGALIIQKSKDGYEWENVDAGKYAKGLYTTDFEANYGTNGKILIYVPEGEEIISGMFYRILYAYEAKNGKTTKNYLEEYLIYLCNASTESVVFHNKTISNSLSESLSEIDNSTAEIYKSAESLRNGSYTTTGFTIDKKNNKTAKIYVKKDGVWIGDDLSEITETGKYDITVTTQVGNSDTYTIYVDKEDEKSIYKRYFGEAFIDGVRVLGNSEYPIFEAGQRTKYHLSQVSNDYLPLYGIITNIDTGKEIKIAGTRTEKSAALTDAGEYVAVFSTNPTFETDNQSGDNRVITFRFTIIEEGTAPGPVVNKQRLYDYSRSSVSDSYPLFYGLTYSGSARGNITLAFATEKDAVDFAYKYETGFAEEADDGTFNYRGTSTLEDGGYTYTGSFVEQKENYEDGWTLADAIYNYAVRSVQKSYFDYGSLYSLSDDVIKATGNLRQLELDHSVVVFAEGQKALLTDLNALPLVNDKPYLYAVPGNGGTDSGYTDFEFTSDIYGADSYEVIITDSYGKEYKIAYNKSVGKQLEQANCPSGVITIVETTKFGQRSEPYNAVFISQGDNTGKLKIGYEIQGKQELKEYTQDECSDVISCDGFWFEEVIDELDPYGLITVSDENGLVTYFAEDNIPDEKWVLEGDYTVKYKNRLGYDFSFVIRVNENDKAVISFEGAASENLDAISASYGDRNLKLPKPERYGYDFDGYVDKDGIKYENEISSVLFKGQLVLNTTWKPKSFVLTTIINNDKNNYDIPYGRQIDLPEPLAPEGYEFVGWTLDGEDYTDSTFVLTEEKNVVLIAKLNKAAGESTEVQPNGSQADDKPEFEADVEKKAGRGWIITIVVMLVIAGAGYGTYWLLKKRGKQDKKRES